MKTVELENLVASVVLFFCENATELGCPRDKEVDIWFRELTEEEMYKISAKLINIIERHNKKDPMDE